MIEGGKSGKLRRVTTICLHVVWRWTPRLNFFIDRMPGGGARGGWNRVTNLGAARFCAGTTASWYAVPALTRMNEDNLKKQLSCRVKHAMPQKRRILNGLRADSFRRRRASGGRGRSRQRYYPHRSKEDKAWTKEQQCQFPNQRNPRTKPRSLFVSWPSLFKPGTLQDAFQDAVPPPGGGQSLRWR